MWDTLVEPSDPKFQTDQYQAHLKSLEYAILSTPDCPEFDMTKEDKFLELYKLSALVYLFRASSALCSRTDRVQPLVDRALALMSQMDTCERTFPLLIIGAESRNDMEQN